MSKKIGLTRRQALAGLGTIGIASAGAGLGTSALFSDTESFDNNVITAGTLDLLVGYYSYWDQGSAGMGQVSGTADGDAITATLGDVKPGDNGLIAFCPEIQTNPAYLWMSGALTSSKENSYTEPEPEDDNGEGELEENIHVEVSYCEVVDDVGDGFDPDDVTEVASVWSGTLAELLTELQSGVALDGDSEGPNASEPVGFPSSGEQAEFAGSDGEENDCICLDWEVPSEVGNEIQGDSLEFDIEFYAEQARNNDNPVNPNATVVSKDGSGDFENIQPAVDNAGEGELILVREGTYNEKVDISTAGLTLQAGGDVTVEYDTGSGQNVLFIDAAGVTIDGIDFVNTYFQQGAILPGANVVSLFGGADDVTLNDVHLSQGQTPSSNACGVLVWSGAGSVDITNSTVTNNWNGVWVADGYTDDLTLDNCNIEDNSAFGIANDTNTEVDATDCWWGASDGPSGSTSATSGVPDDPAASGATGSGDAVTDDVDYSNWLGSSA